MQIPGHFKTRRLRRGYLGSVEQDEFLDIIIFLLHLGGGQLRRHEVINRIRDLFSSQFSAADFKLLTSQTPPKERWIHNVDWAKRKLVVQNILLPPSRSPYGMWVLSEKGKSNMRKKLD